MALLDMPRGETMRRDAPFDPVSLEILWTRLISIVDASALALLRTSFSTNVRESNDFATVLTDLDGAALCENSAGIPSFVGMLPRTIKHLLQRIRRESWHPGDCFITNDPWIATGHLPDVALVAPIFHRGRLVAFSGSVAHVPDIGGSGWAADCRELFEEGIRIPVVKYLDAGKQNADLVELILANVRVPDQVLGDIEAQVAAHHVCASELAEFLDDTRLTDLSGLSLALQDRADTSMRNAIDAIPDGVYRSSVVADGFFDDDETRIECAITVDGTTLDVNYNGTSKQIDRGLNSVPGYTYAYTAYPIKCALDPVTPRNEGSFRAITVDAPAGTILNPRFPAPCNARQLTGHLLAGAVYGALASVIPDHVIAECGGAPPVRSVYSGTDQFGNRFSQVLYASGGMGGGPAGDGHSCTAFPTNAGSGSIEALETTAPLIVWRKEFRTDSGGAGKFRGGLGQDVEIEVASEAPVRLSLLSDRTLHAPRGLLGGCDGARVEISLADGTKPHPKARTILNPGDRIILRYGGGGGYGEPMARDRDRIKRDIREGYISPEAAWRDYGFENSDDAPRRPPTAAPISRRA